MAATIQSSSDAHELLRPQGENTVELTFRAPSPTSLPLHRRLTKNQQFIIIGGVVTLIGAIGLITVLLVQYKMAQFPSHQHVMVVDVKNDVVEAALIRRANPALRRSQIENMNAEHPIDSTVVDVCGRKGGDIKTMIEGCVNDLVPAIPKKSVPTALVFVLTGREILKQWVGCNVTSDAKKIGNIAEEIAQQHSKVLKLADDGDQGVRLVMAKQQAVSSFIGANRQHLEKESVGIIGIDSKSTFLAFHYDPPTPPPTSEENKRAVFDEQVAGNRVTAFSEAFYCFGVDELWRIYLSTLLGGNPMTRTAKDPCAPSQTVYSLEWDEVWQTSCAEPILRSQERPLQCPEDRRNFRQVARVDFTGSGNPAECRTRLATLFKTAQGRTSSIYAGRTIPQDLRGEFILFDNSGAVARALEFVYRDREGPEKQDETVLDGKDLYLGDVTAAVHEFCLKSFDPRAIRMSYGINASKQDIEGRGPNSDWVLRRTCFDAFYAVEFMASLGIVRARADDKPRNHFVLARPPSAQVDPSSGEKMTARRDHGDIGSDHAEGHPGVHHSEHLTAEWYAGYLETGAAISGDFRKVRPLSPIAFGIIVFLLAVCVVAGAIIIILFLMRMRQQLVPPGSQMTQELEVRA